MKLHHQFLFAVLFVTNLIALSAERGSGNGTPPVPNGFTAKRLDKIRCEVFVPKGWQVSSFDKGGTICYKITEDATCQKGLTVNVITNVSNLTKASSQRLGRVIDAKSYAVFQNEQYKEKCTKVLDDWSKDTSMFTYCGCEVIKRADNVESRIRATAIANKKTDTLYIFLFGSPVAEWDKLLPTIKTMMTVDIDENF